METIEQLAAVLGDECFAEYRCVASGYRGPWRSMRVTALQDAREHAGAYGYRIERRIAP